MLAEGTPEAMHSGEALDQLPHRLALGMAEDEEILAWSRSDVEAFTERNPAEEVARAIRRLVEIGDGRALGVLCSFLAARGPGLDDKPAPSQLAVRGLVLSGPIGIDAFGKALRTQRVRYSAKALVVLIRVAEGNGLTSPMGPRESSRTTSSMSRSPLRPPRPPSGC